MIDYSQPLEVILKQEFSERGKPFIEKARKSYYEGMLIGDMDHDELLAVIGMMMNAYEDQSKEKHHIIETLNRCCESRERRTLWQFFGF